MDWLSGVWEFLPKAVDPGWASIIAALVALAAAVITAGVGIAIIKRQARLGFEALIRSQANEAELDRTARAEQAELDRAARDHQATIERSVAADRVMEDRRTLAASLVGELMGISTAIRNGSVTRRLMIAVYETFPNTVIKQASPLWPHLETSVYAANVSRIGLLGPSIAADVVAVWQIPVFRPPGEGLENLTAGTLAKAMAAINDSFDNWQLDMNHVHIRLLSLYGTAQDPGPLFYERQRREAADKQTAGTGASTA